MRNKAATPTVSVILPTYQMAHFLPQAIESILNQSFSDLELLIVDDGSDKPEPRQIAQRYARQDDRIRLISLPTNQGVANARNQAIKQATGTYIALQDDDDVSLPDRFAEQVDFMNAHPGIASVAGQILYCDQDLKVCGSWAPARGAPVFLPARPPSERWQQFSAGNISALMRRDCVLATGGYRPWFTVASDWDMTFLLQDKYRLASMPKPAVMYREIHSGSQLTKHPKLWHYHNAALISAHYRRTGRKDPIEKGVQVESLMPLMKELPLPLRLQRYDSAITRLSKALKEEQDKTAAALCRSLTILGEFPDGEERPGSMPQFATLQAKDILGSHVKKLMESDDAPLTAKVLSRLPQTAAVRETEEWCSLFATLQNPRSLEEKSHCSALMQKLDFPQRRPKWSSIPPSMLWTLINLLIRHRFGIPKQLRQILLSQVKQNPSRMEPLLEDTLFCASNLKALMRLGHYGDIRFLLNLYAIGAAQGVYRSHLRRLKGKTLKYSLLYFKPGYWFAR